MRILVEVIVRSHPAKSSLSFRRDKLGEFELEAAAFELLNNVNDGELWWLVKAPRKRLHIGAIRIAALSDEPYTTGDIGAVVDVVDDEVLELICGWAKERFNYIKTPLDLKPKEYITWAKEHEVWP